MYGVQYFLGYELDTKYVCEREKRKERRRERKGERERKREKRLRERENLSD